ncbi:MAG: ADYC domain-containing protein [Kofleriaceae bacterium]
MKLVPLLMLTMAACAVDGATDVESTEQAVGGGPCPTWGCGANSPIMGTFMLDELDANGSPNASYVKVLDIVLKSNPSTKMKVNVVADRLFAVDNTVSPSKTYGGNDLLGAAIELSVGFPGVPTQRRNLYIRGITTKDTSTTTFWQGKSDPVETYELYASVSQQELTKVERVCPNPPPAGSPDGEGRIWNSPFQSIIFTGDRYHADTKVAYDTDYASSAGWFNIACAGGAVAKLHLNRMTTAGTSADVTSSTNQRTAFLKMITGDFCGTGASFTQAGAPLYWTGNGLTGQDTGSNNLSRESWWNVNGAMCLDEQRMHNVSGAFYDYQSLIQEACPKNPCTLYLKNNPPLFTSHGAGNN